MKIVLDLVFGGVSVASHSNKEAETIHQLSHQNVKTALAGVAQWMECWPANQRITALIPGWDTCLGCRPGPRGEGL